MDWTLSTTCVHYTMNSLLLLLLLLDVAMSSVTTAAGCSMSCEHYVYWYVYGPHAKLAIKQTTIRNIYSTQLGLNQMRLHSCVFCYAVVYSIHI